MCSVVWMMLVLALSTALRTVLVKAFVAKSHFISSISCNNKLVYTTHHTLKSITTSSHVHCDKYGDRNGHDTVYALSSGPMTKCGVSVLRISGPLAYYCVDSLF